MPDRAWCPPPGAAGRTRPGPLPPLLLALAMALGSAVASPPPTSQELEAARRLTWEAATRDEGVARLRALVRAEPAAVAPRFELGRVLTWDESTRAEGIRLLRDLAGEQPDRPEMQEALADVLSWNVATRTEAVARLRGVLQRDSRRRPARLLLARILSWDRGTRGEAEEMFGAVLREQPDSAEARLGLARILSWRGDLAGARAEYRRILATEPDHAEARMGLAEVEQWSGRRRAALDALLAAPPGSLDTPEAFQRRAEAYAGIGRPARALAEYEALAAARPDDPGIRRAVDAARLQLRPSLEIGLDASDEDGDSATTRVRIVSAPLRFAWHPRRGDAELSLLASASRYSNDPGHSTDRSVGAGLDAPLGGRLRLSGEIRLHDFDAAGSEITGSAGLRFAAGDRIELQAALSREQVFSSRLSLGGEVIDGVLYGPVLEDALAAAITARPGRSWSLWARAQIGRLAGEGIADNDRRAAFAGFGRELTLGRATLRPGYALTWFAFDKDLGGYPPADLGGDGIDSRGVGGYFSPFRFLNQMIRLDATAPIGESVLLFAGGGIGRQEVEDADTGPDPQPETSSDAYLGCRWQVRDRLAVRGQISYQNVAAAFDRSVARVTLVYVF